MSYKESAKKCLDNPAVSCVYFAVLLVLVLLATYYLYKLSANKEHITGVGLGHGGGYSGQSAGATQRFAQEFSGTNQSPRTTVLTADVAEIAPGLSRVGRPVNIYGRGESLVSGRGEPDFWEVSGLVDQYKTGQTPGMYADAAAKLEHLTGAAKISNAEDEALARLL